MTGKTQKGRWRSVMAAAAMLALGAPAMAQDGHGCSNLLYSDTLPSIEGRDGTFFRLNPDLHNFHWITEESVDQLARLSQVLQRHGTTLIYVPLPTKALAMPENLPRAAADVGYDPDLAASVHTELLDRLRAAGIATLDARRALRAQANGGRAPFFGPDHRLTSAGAAALAMALGTEIRALAGYDALETRRYDLRRVGETDLPSVMRLQLQRHCVADLPPVVTEVFEATADAQALTAGNALLDAGRIQPAPVMLAATEIAGEPALNLAGLIASATGLETASHMVRGGDAFAAISALMTAPEFRANRPRVLIWVNPVWNGLGVAGDQPMRELIAAAGDTCDRDISLARLDDGRFRADLSALPPNGPVLQLDTGRIPAQRAAFHFLSRDGLRRTRSVHRHPGQATSRVFMPMSALWPEGVSAVEIALDARLDTPPRLMACEES